MMMIIIYSTYECKGMHLYNLYCVKYIYQIYADKLRRHLLVPLRQGDVGILLRN